MLGYMNAVAWAETQASGKVTFFSRSKKRLWTKGEESGNYLSLVRFSVDCDRDTLLIQAKPAGPICLDEHPSTLHEKRVDALQKLLTGDKLRAFTTDAMRRAIESNTEEDYRNLPYYDKWMRAVRDLVIEQQLVSAKEIEDRIAILRERYKQTGSL